ncbi:MULTISPECIES: plasmid partitioning protein RepB [unclassified Rhizobium]|uniref:plasmid partitioning protein RepB n=1 Tax=Rhizobium sp. PP-CC-3G-465 TaxID=2135648 RepID=UPI000D85B055|nr:ParB family chromosome partitioning protein [Rhizobium sp. PP-WC-1G-195]TCQ25961.1 ParB family chromosome partitioning protein [Rhizobium sp. PP-CC-3G-465]
MMAGNRKSELKALFGGGLSPADVVRAAEAQKPGPSEGPAPEQKSAENPTNPGTPGTPGEGVPLTPHTRSASGAVKVMGLSLNAITREAEEARALRQALSEGEHVVGIDPARIEASFVEDRLVIDGPADEDFEALVESVREAGQQVPVLLRPHPEKHGVYQTAYGHRRIRAAARLGRPVKAIIRALTDDELVLAQGKENAERRNLSFIERALFARNLTERGFDRKTIGDALAVQKSELSRLMQVAEGVPDRFIRFIGPAPKVGRERWMKLGEILSKDARQVQALDVVYSDRFKAADSDRRFQILFSHLDALGKPMKTKRRAGQAESGDVRSLTDARGRVFARLKVENGATRIEFAEGTPPAFIDAAAALLAEAHETFEREADGES